MSTAGSTPAQSKVFVDEMKRRARRQVLGALALLFLSLTVLPVLFEKRSSDRSPSPHLRWETTHNTPKPADPAENPSGAITPIPSPDTSIPDNATQTEKAQTPQTDDTPAIRASQDTKPLKKNQESALKIASTKTSAPSTQMATDDTPPPPENAAAATIIKKNKAPAITAQKAKTPQKNIVSASSADTNNTPLSDTTPTTPLHSQEKKHTEKKIAKPHTKKPASEKIIRSEDTALSQTDRGDLRNDELEDIRPAKKKASKLHDTENNETQFKRISDNNDAPIRPIRATKTRVNAATADEDVPTESSSAPHATKKRLNDNESAEPRPKSEHSSTSNPPSSYVVQLAALGSEDKALNLKARLSDLGLSAYTQRISTKQGGTVYRVRLGPYTHKESAEKTLRTLRNQGYSAILTPVHRPTQSR